MTCGNLGEEWRPVLGGDYEVSNMGRVRRAKPGRRTYVGRLMQPILLKIGYFMVAPTVAGKNKQIYVHRLVAEAFLGPCPDGHEVNHIDGVKSNNMLSNLEYVTHAGNMRHAQQTGLLPDPATAPRVRGDEHWTRKNPERIRRGDNSPLAKLTSATVRELRALHKLGASQKDLSARFAIGRSQVCRLVNGRSWQHLGGNSE